MFGKNWGLKGFDKFRMGWLRFGKDWISLENFDLGNVLTGLEKF